MLISGCGVWYSADPDVYLLPYRYRAISKNGSTVKRTVWVLSPKDFPKLLSEWNRQADLQPDKMWRYLPGWYEKRSKTA